MLYCDIVDGIYICIYIRYHESEPSETIISPYHHRGRLGHPPLYWDCRKDGDLKLPFCVEIIYSKTVPVCPPIRAIVGGSY